MKLPLKVVVCVISIILIFVAVAEMKLLAIRQVNIEIDDTDCVNEKQVKEYLRAEDKNPWVIDYPYLSENIIDMHPCIKRSTIDYRFPSTLVVKVQSRVPAARVLSYTPKDLDLELREASPSSSSALLDWSFPSSSVAGFLVEEDGWLYANSEYFLPVLFYPENELKLGQLIDKHVAESISEVFTKIKALQLNFYQAKVQDQSLLMDTNPRVVMSLKDGLAPQLASLQLILAQSTMDNEVIESVDLRFAKPVVVYVTKKK